MNIYVAGKFTELVFNLDELGSADWDDYTDRKVIVPVAVHQENIYDSVSYRQRHVTPLACVSATGDATISLFISANPIRDSLWSWGVKQDEDVMVRRRTPGLCW
jgi:hypothetical protein